MSKIFDALRKAELEPNPFADTVESQRTLVTPHPRRVRIFEREFTSLSNAVQGYFPRSSTGNMIMVLGCVEGEGASYVASNLSRTLAKTSGAPILCMEGNFHDPGVRENFPMAHDQGLADLYSSGSLSDLSSSIQTTDTSHLYVLGAGRSRVSPVAFFDSEEFQRIQVSLRRTFKFIIVDGPPVLKHSDALQLATHVNGVVLVVRQKRLTREVIRKGIEKLQGVNAPLIGGILNRRRFAIPTLLYKLIS